TFYNCTSLTDVSIPNSITSIGNQAFYNCSALENISVNLPTPLTIDANVFEYVTLSSMALKVPAASVENYKTFDVWRDFGSITAL
ncbi:leucine-rich repeat protein, partial [Polaribacter sp.]|uniref:leucine-rich repeat protein n=1 Tax=Polaribacter sp. TaxID=1920175 RepID=UPI003F4C3DD9